MVLRGKVIVREGLYKRLWGVSESSGNLPTENVEKVSVWPPKARNVGAVQRCSEECGLVPATAIIVMANANLQT